MPLKNNSWNENFNLPDLLKFSWIISSYPLADLFEFRACLIVGCLFSQNINNIFKQACQREQKNNSKILRRSGYFSIFHFLKAKLQYFLYPDFNDFYLFPIDGIGLPPPLVGQNSTIFGFENEAYNSSPMRKVWYN